MGVKSSIHRALKGIGEGNKTDHKGSGVNTQNAYIVHTPKRGLAKTDSRFWLQKGKLRRNEGSVTWWFQFQIAGRRFTFSTRTGNKEISAKIAARIFSDFAELGVEAALRKHRSNKDNGSELTLGQWTASARRVFAGNARTFEAYAMAARQIAGDLINAKRTKERFGRKGGDFAKKVATAPLSIFSASKIQEWRLRYVRERGAENPAKLRSARTSSNALLRNARSLFSEKIRKFLPPIEGDIPFAGVEFFPRESMRYQSKIDAGILLIKAREELEEKHPEEFKALLLLLGAGLRRGEVDSLLWKQIDLEQGVIHIEITEVGGLKTEDSAGEVDLDSTMCGILRRLKTKAKSQFYLSQRSRCQEICVVCWMHENGVELACTI